MRAIELNIEAKQAELKLALRTAGPKLMLLLRPRLIGLNLGP